MVRRGATLPAGDTLVLSSSSLSLSLDLSIYIYYIFIYTLHLICCISDTPAGHDDSGRRHPLPLPRLRRPARRGAAAARRCNTVLLCCKKIYDNIHISTPASAARHDRRAALQYCIVMLQKKYDNIHMSTPASAARCDRRAALWRCIIIYCI